MQKEELFTQLVINGTEHSPITVIDSDKKVVVDMYAMLKEAYAIRYRDHVGLPIIMGMFDTLSKEAEGVNLHYQRTLQLGDYVLHYYRSVRNFLPASAI